MAKAKKTKEIAVKSSVGAFSNKEYASTLASLKKQIQESQLKAVTAANKELIRLYWTIGKTVVEKQEKSGWGTKLIEKLANDLQNEFPGIEGFSRTNIFRMRAFYQGYKIVPPAVGQIDEIEHLGVLSMIPWSHNIVLLEKLKSVEDRIWYARETLQNGWSRNVLSMWIDSNLHKRKGKAITNFKATLPSPQSDLAQNTLKDPYLLDFMTVHKEAVEKDIENRLMEHMQKFLVELGQGFAFVGRQLPVKAGKKDLYIDLLFYHLQLRCYLIVELKSGEFDSRDAGQMSAYLSAVDDTIKHPDDNPSIGMILCRTKDNVFVEYVLRNFNRPIGVAEYETKLVEKLPKELKSSLPTIEEIEEELEQDIQNIDIQYKNKTGHKKIKEK